MRLRRQLLDKGVPEDVIESRLATLKQFDYGFSVDWLEELVTKARAVEDGTADIIDVTTWTLQ